MSTLLNVAARPTVYFDANDKNHRRYFAKFLVARSWGNCPVQFYLEQEYADILTMCQDKLTAYYLGREFRETIPTLEQTLE
jgi:hypothetical protein